MRVRLVGIAEEGIYDDPQNSGGSVGAGPRRASRYVVMASLRLVEGQEDAPYSGLNIPYEAIKGAQVGDEFTLHLERAR